jgi:hypothetical protein
MKAFVLDYIGDREVTFMMILDNAMYFRHGEVLRRDDEQRDTLAKDVSGILKEYEDNGAVSRNEYNFYYRKDLRDA